MPEENFEQQARHMAERFRMEPTPDIWQRVQAAIAPEKRRRRGLVWWWLLPLGFAGAVAAYFVNHHRALSPDKDGMAVTKIRETKKETNVHVEKNENHQAVVNSNRIVPKQNRKENKERRTATDLPEEKNEQNEVITRQNEAAKNKNSESKKENNETCFAELLRQKAKTVINHDSLSKAAPALISGEVASRDEEVKKDTTAASVTHDSLQLKRDAATAVDKQRDNKKKNNTKSWQFGVMAEAGIASRGKSLFRFNNDNESKSLTPAPADPLGNTGGNNADTLTGSRVLVYQTIRHGVDAAAGMAVRKTLSQHLYISGQFSYRYQQYTVRNLVRDSVFVGGVFSLTFANVPAGDVNYHLHFLNLFTGIGWQYVAGKKNTLSVEIGLDNSLLMTAKQRKRNQSSQFNNSIGNNSDIGNFYRWQPHANIALPVAFHNKSIHWQVSPFARFGLHLLEKNNSSYKDNHLVSAGIQAIYFFK